MTEQADDEVVVFRGAEEAYLKWIGDHRGGWVVNANKNPKPDYLQLHKAWCATISEPRRAGAYTERDYIKICAVRKPNLDAYLEGMVGAKPRWNCNRCG